MDIISRPFYEVFSRARLPGIRRHYPPCSLSPGGQPRRGRARETRREYRDPFGLAAPLHCGGARRGAPFLVQRQAVGNIAFNENATVPVFPPYQGRIIRAFPDLGDEVKKDQVLFTLESPDFIAAQSTLIADAATLVQTDSVLGRAKLLYADKSIDQNDYEAAVANHQSAEGALKAAREAMLVFGRTPQQIDRVIAKHEVERALIVKSPVTGRITARNAAPGTLLQPGNAPAPYTVADESTLWMIADVPEMDSIDIKVGAPVMARSSRCPGRCSPAR